MRERMLAHAISMWCLQLCREHLVHGEFVNYAAIGIWKQPMAMVPPRVMSKDGMGGRRLAALSGSRRYIIPAASASASRCPTGPAPRRACEHSKTQSWS
jgi:hypothetical protein